MTNSHKSSRWRSWSFIAVMAFLGLALLYAFVLPWFLPTPAFALTLGEPDADGAVELHIEVRAYHGIYQVSPAVTATAQLYYADGTTTATKLAAFPSTRMVPSGNMEALFIFPRKREFAFSLSPDFFGVDASLFEPFRTASRVVVSAEAGIETTRTPWYVLLLNHAMQQNSPYGSPFQTHLKQQAMRAYQGGAWDKRQP